MLWLGARGHWQSQDPCAGLLRRVQWQLPFHRYCDLLPTGWLLGRLIGFNILGRGSLQLRLLLGQQTHLQLLQHLPSYLLLNIKDVGGGKLAVITLAPHVKAVPRLHQLRRNAHPSPRFAYAPSKMWLTPNSDAITDKFWFSPLNLNEEVLQLP